LRTIFQFVICFISWQLISAMCEELDERVCVLLIGFEWLSIQNGTKMGITREEIKSDGQEISTIEWQELKNEFHLLSDYKKLLTIEEI